MTHVPLLTEETIKLASGAVCACGVGAFWFLQFRDASFARFYKGSAFGFSLPGSVAWFLMEAVTPLFLVLSYVAHGGSLVPVSKLPLVFVLLFVHYFYRTFVFPFTRSLKPWGGEVFLAGVAFNLINGTLIGSSAALGITESAPKWMVVLGTVMWALGFIGNIHSDEVTRRLRSGPKDKDTYKIPPAEGMHRFLCSPNYSCEVFEWLGMSVASNFSPATVTFVFFCACNLVPHAIANRRWYLQKFGEKYPQSRKIFIPFIW